MRGNVAEAHLSALPTGIYDLCGFLLVCKENLLIWKVLLTVALGLKRFELPLSLKLLYFPISLGQIKGEIFLKPLPRKFMVGERRGRGQSISVHGTWTVPNKWDDEIPVSVHTCLFTDIVATYKYKHLCLCHLVMLLQHNKNITSIYHIIYSQRCFWPISGKLAMTFPTNFLTLSGWAKGRDPGQCLTDGRGRQKSDLPGWEQLAGSLASLTA